MPDAHSLAAPPWKVAPPSAAAYSCGVAVAAVALLVLLDRPVADPAYLALGASLLIGALLTLRDGEEATGTSVLVVPALAAWSWVGPVAAPALAWAALAAALIRRQEPTEAILESSHDALAFIGASGAARAIGGPGPLSWIVFAATFVMGRWVLWEVARRLAVGLPTWNEARADRGAPVIELSLAPLAALPILAGALLGLGALLLGLAGVSVALVVVREVASLALARAEMERKRDELAAAVKLQDELIQLISHDVKNPLSIIIARSQVARLNLARGHTDSMGTDLDYVEQAARLIERLVDNLLQISRLEQPGALPPPESVSVRSLITEVVGQFRSQADSKGVLMNVDLARSGTLTVVAPRLLLQEALANLVSNAVKYTPSGGSATVEAEGTMDGQVVISVADTGIGLSAADQKRLFTRFFRSSDPAARAQRGTGLGLALTHGIVRRLGGTIEVESEPGKGTTFRLLLPSEPAKEQAA